MVPKDHLTLCHPTPPHPTDLTAPNWTAPGPSPCPSPVLMQVAMDGLEQESDRSLTMIEENKAAIASLEGRIAEKDASLTDKEALIAENEALALVHSVIAEEMAARFQIQIGAAEARCAPRGGRVHCSAWGLPCWCTAACPVLALGAAAHILSATCGASIMCASVWHAVCGCGNEQRWGPGPAHLRHPTSRRSMQFRREPAFLASRASGRQIASKWLFDHGCAQAKLVYWRGLCAAPSERLESRCAWLLSHGFER